MNKRVTMLVVDDAAECRQLMLRMLEGREYGDIYEAQGAADTFTFFGLDVQGEGTPNRNLDLDLLLLDIIMPEIDGIEVCRRLKAHPLLKDIPIIMITASHAYDKLCASFELGVVDYLRKPIKKIELRARVKLALRLKREMDRRMVLTQQLEQANQRLQQIAMVDGLTGIANRYRFDEFFEREWRRCQRDRQSLAVCLADIDFFKLYNDTYGHLQGDEALKQVATAFQSAINRPGDLVARFGGEEFIFVLPDSDATGGRHVALRAIEVVCSLALPHRRSTVAEHLTICVGVAATRPRADLSPFELLEHADKALYEAKKIRGNKVVVASQSS